jgi:hypothetical protein
VGAAAADPTTPGPTAVQENARVAEAQKKYAASGGRVTQITGKVERHHIASNKAPKWAERFELLFEGAGMTLSDKRNIVSLQDHGGPHGDDYHQIVFNRLTEAVKGKQAGSQAYKDAFTDELRNLKRDVLRPGSPLNDLATRP